MRTYEQALEARKTPHEWVPYSITKDDDINHTCNGRCACRDCALEWRDPIHTNRPKRRSKNAPKDA